MQKENQGKPYWNPLVGGTLLGIVLFLSFLLSGHGLGASGGVNRVVVAVEDVVAPRHVDTTPYLAEIAGGDKQFWDHWIFWELIGIILGGFISGLVHKRFRPETFKGPNITDRTRLIGALTGGLLMGYGARLARGCTSGQALSGGATLSVGSWAFMLAVFAGAYFMAIFARRLWR